MDSFLNQFPKHKAFRYNINKRHHLLSQIIHLESEVQNKNVFSRSI